MTYSSRHSSPSRSNEATSPDLSAASPFDPDRINLSCDDQACHIATNEFEMVNFDSDERELST